MGHSTNHMTANLYTHLDPKHSKEAAPQMDAQFREEEWFRRYWQPFLLVSAGLDVAPSGSASGRMVSDNMMVVATKQGFIILV
jgi:hypothetical protein